MRTNNADLVNKIGVDAPHWVQLPRASQTKQPPLNWRLFCYLLDYKVV